MTRWLSGIVLVISSFLPLAGFAQGQYPQSGFQNTGYLGSPGPSQQYAGMGAGGYYRGGQGGPYAQLTPDDNGWMFGPDTRLGNILSNKVNKAWVRFDVLHWEIRGADDTLLGAPVAPNAAGVPYDLSGQDRQRRLDAQDRILGARPQTVAVVPRIGEAQESGLNGFRGTFGIPLTIGDFEASAFVLEEFNDLVKVDPFVDNFAFQNTTLIGAVTLLNNGVVNNNTMILFSEGMRASLTTNIYGIETNLIANPMTPNASMLIRPIAGFRYLSMEEKLSISGQDIPDPLNDPTTILDHRINSLSQNHIFGPQVGFRAESKIKRFTLGTDFKFLFGINRLQDQVNTAQIFTVDELPVTSTDENTRFAPMIDFSVYGKYQATENLNLVLSYQLLAGTGFSRAYDNIDYNAPASVNDPPIIGTRNELSNFYAQGLVVGIEFLFP
ncbi:BBP7 family outer membrane beta-barrel protein [Thalassoglobus polymorphus]|uniref:Uncharacterized protein n=1 Tax=Thalassoglobus polymorphus TaxID=2527994 RepID=A0A517QKV6_9PLAN|nr:BBP7 family outer membrane beta-barrel protein [Thalassoglobus polymorphus]QDT32280.1 hypothetical protein Mal48_15230 [Thalassoglobus polymorphus]